MSTLRTHFPASMRSGVTSRNTGEGGSTEFFKPYLVQGKVGRTGLAGRTPFLALFKESEDARITGATRSLDRRLLALNLRGLL